jgi:hypothetical protein
MNDKPVNIVDNRFIGTEVKKTDWGVWLQKTLEIEGFYFYFIFVRYFVAIVDNTHI